MSNTKLPTYEQITEQDLVKLLPEGHEYRHIRQFHYEYVINGKVTSGATTLKALLWFNLPCVPKIQPGETINVCDIIFEESK